MDWEFTRGLFEYVDAEGEAAPHAGGLTRFDIVNMLLNEVAASAALTTATAECRHAAVQRQSLHNNRGARRCIRRIGADSYICSVRTEWESMASRVDELTLPSRRSLSQILQRIATTGRGHHSIPVPEGSRRIAAHKDSLEDRLCEHLGKGTRAVSGWNVFQASRMRGEQLTPAAWGDEVDDLGREWAGIRGTAAEEPWQVRAAELNSEIQVLRSTPLPVGQCRERDLGVPEKTMKRVSTQRLLLNFEVRARHPGWGYGLSLAGPTGAVDAEMYAAWRTGANVDDANEDRFLAGSFRSRSMLTTV